MMSNPHNSGEDKRTREAWERLQEKLAAEPINDKWETWGSESEQNDLKLVDSLPAPAVSAAASNEASQLTTEAPAPAKASRRRASSARKWVAAAAAAVIFGAVLATPMGNNALAAILNQFRVQEIATVDSDTLESLFYQLTPGETFSKDNTFGQFTTRGGTVQGEFTREQAASRLGYQLLSPDLTGGEEKVYISPSNEITMKMNVKELNQAMQRVGATKVLPESIDGKAITLTLHESVNYDLNTDQGHWASLAQMQAPEITVDPSVDVEEALEAVLQLPILPANLKDQLQQTRILSGSIPMPYIVDKNAKTDDLTIGGTKVLVEEREYSSLTDRTAIWIKDGQLFCFQGGSAYATEADFMNKLKELVGA
ncbi:hypothetical protein [Paenibacillus macerans]|uniref:hypothetical protein n=1 Tax=Paenibacillus macerans TaxID=44252 RepID=UPI00203BCBD8|nr:hypothetical protein [Paenibacillus macerans]MCM3697971.1 hypothetical protein [Paenibacillus macerans]